MSKRALIIGIGGCDGSYLAEILLEKGYDVHGIARRTSTDNLTRLSDSVRSKCILHFGDLSDSSSIERVIRSISPNYIYNEADQDHVGYSKETPQVSINITAGAVQRLLETVLRFDKSIKVFQPISATIYKGNTSSVDENSPIEPNSPYACAKLCALHLCRYYRRLGVDVTCGILFNHESPRRRGDYLLQRIIRQAVELKEGEKIKIANPHMDVDIGYAKEYMECVVRLMEMGIPPNDYNIGTSTRISIYSLVYSCLQVLGNGGTNPCDRIEMYNDSRFKDEPTLISNCHKMRNITGKIPIIHSEELIRMIMQEKGLIV